jgi:hypothetical protein
LRQPVLSYYGDGKFSLSLFYLSHDNHFHSSEVVDAWSTAGEDAPEGYSFQYTPNADLGEISNETTAVFCAGLLQLPGAQDGDFTIEDNVLYSKTDTTGVIIFNHFPFAYGSPVVRNVRSTDESLGVTNRNGMVTLNPTPWVVGAARRSRLAVSNIGGRTVNYTPVVTDVTTGNGITVTHNTDGSVKLSASDRVGEPIDAYNLNFNGTTLASDDNLNTYITFPASRTSASLAISLPLTGISSGANLTAKVWGIVQGTGQTFNVVEQFSAHPSNDNPSVLDAPASSSFSLPLTGTSGALTYAETSGGVVVTGNGSLSAKILLPAAPNADVRLVRAGFRLVESASSTSDTPAPLDDIVGTVIGSGAALTALPAFTCVYAVSGGGLRACSSTDINTLNKCVGVTIETVSSGAIATYVTDGVLQSPALSISGGGAVYVGPSGGLTNSADYENWAYVQQAGLAVADGAIVVNIKNGTAGNE